MKTKILAGLSFLLVLGACQKDTPATDGGGTTPETDYQPVTPGSTWQYSSTSSGNYSETAVAGDTTIEGEKYYFLDNSNDGRRYINKSANVYKTYGYVKQIDQYVNITYLKDAAVGTTWKSTVTYNAIPVDFNFMLVSRDGTKTVNGKEYQNVIAVDYTITADNPLLGGRQTLATGHRFYAKGVGSISSSLNFDALGTVVTDSTYLISSDIK